MKNLNLFCDGSVNPQLNIGYGSYFILDDIDTIDLSKIEISIKRFEDTSSTKLELETLLWALSQIKDIDKKVFVYTDCQNILGLKSRRERLENSNYYTKKNKLINNHLLYKEFYKIIDKIDCDFIKVKGHKKSDEKDKIDKLFTLVDRASREALRTNGNTKS